jgi:predicted nuclease of predicted toxin-antitoxin system
VRLLLDECSGSHALRDLLTAAGHDVERSIDAVGAAASDAHVLEHAMRNERAIVTMNCGDFLGLVQGRKEHPGLLLHYRGAHGGLTNAQLVDAIGNVERTLGNVREKVVALNQFAWKTH